MENYLEEKTAKQYWEERNTKQAFFKKSIREASKKDVEALAEKLFCYAVLEDVCSSIEAAMCVLKNFNLEEEYRNYKYEQFEDYISENIADDDSGTTLYDLLSDLGCDVFNNYCNEKKEDSVSFKENVVSVMAELIKEQGSLSFKNILENINEEE